MESNLALAKKSSHQRKHKKSILLMFMLNLARVIRTPGQRKTFMT